MADCNESKVDIRGTGIHVRRGGSGELMLFLHGASGVAGWLPAFELLSKMYDLLVPDHPTYGGVRPWRAIMSMPGRSLPK